MRNLVLLLIGLMWSSTVFGGASRLFDNASSEYLDNGTAAVFDFPFTFAGWVKSDDNSGRKVLVSQAIVASASGAILLELNGTTPRYILESDDALEFIILSSSVDPVRDQWVHIAGVSQATNSHFIYVDGIQRGTTGDTCPICSCDRTDIGAFSPATVATHFMSGNLAHIAIWSDALDPGEIQSLAAGISPLKIRPDKLERYIPIWGDTDPELDYSGNNQNFNLNNTPAGSEDGPPIYF